MLNSGEADIVTLVQDRSALGSLLPQWRQLAERCAEDCAYYAPHTAMALLDTVAANSHVRFITAWAGDRLVGFMPVIVPKVRVPGLTAAGLAWQTDYTFSCTPLLDAGLASEAAEAIVGALMKLAPGEWILKDINSEGPACLALISALGRKGVPHCLTTGFERAQLTTGVSFEQHMQTQVSSKRRRDLARNLRRLQEMGTVEFRSATHGPSLRDAIGAFLELEVSGWKGKRGTALACRPETRRFAELAFTSEEPGKVRADLLLLNGKPIAAGLILFAGRTGFTVKGAYDERYASQGAGLLLEQEVIRSFLTDGWADRLDAATNGSHVIDFLWPGRTRVADLAFSLATRSPQRRLDLFMRMKAREEQARAKLRRLRSRFG